MVDLRGTALMPTSKGKVRVDSTAGATRMKAETTKDGVSANVWAGVFDVLYSGRSARKATRRIWESWC